MLSLSFNKLIVHKLSKLNSNIPSDNLKRIFAAGNFFIIFFYYQKYERIYKEKCEIFLKKKIWKDFG